MTNLSLRTHESNRAQGESRLPAKTPRSLAAIDFFCGAGGMTRGLLDAGIEVIAGVDVDPDCRQSYNANFFGVSKFVQRDIRMIKTEDVFRMIGDDHSADDLVLVGCSPCQYWSKVNTSRQRSEASKTLLVEFGRIVEEVRPGWVVVENVPGLARREGGRVLQDFLEQLNSAGLNAVAQGHVRATQYGVPQKRERFLLIASRVVRRVTLPPPSTAVVATVRDIIGHGLRSLAAGESCPEDALHRASCLSDENLRRIQMTPSNGGSRDSWKDTDLQIPAYVGKPDHFRDVYGRMRWDEPAPTITTRFNSLSNGRFGHPEQDRAITVREGALLQTFPRSHLFVGPMPSVCRQIGNAVPPALASAIGTHLLHLVDEDGEA